MKSCLLLFFVVITCTVSLESRPATQSEVEKLQVIEQQRLKALVEANVELADKLHAEDFQLINPFGQAYSKEQYLNGIKSGGLDYLIWEPVSTIEVRVYGEGAVIRYQSKLQIVVRGEKIPLKRYWHTDSYEKRNGQWQVVWSQATEIKES